MKKLVVNLKDSRLGKSLSKAPKPGRVRGVEVYLVIVKWRTDEPGRGVEGVEGGAVAK